MYRPVNKYFKSPKPIAPINEHIKAPEVRVINEKGEHLGVMPTSKALELARDAELDLVETSSKANPPLVKIISYDKYRYQVEKEKQQQKKSAKKIEVKSIRLSVRIGQHDMETKARMADKFLKEGDKVRVELMLRGREKANVDFAFEQFNKYLQTVQQAHSVEQPPKKLGGTITALLSPT